MIRLSAHTLGIWLALGTIILAQSTTRGIPSFFPYNGQWHGGDVAYSIPLSPGRYLWLFGDSFVGKPSAERNPDDSMPRNTLAIADCDNRLHCSFQYHWRQPSSGVPRAFFDTGSEEWYWPLDGFVANGKLYVFLERMHVAGDSAAFGFAYSGVVLASIENFSDSPPQWHIVYQKILDGDTVVPGVAAVLPVAIPNLADSSLDPAYAYLFTWKKSDESAYLALTRLRLSALDDARLASNHWEYLSKSDAWIPWNTPVGIAKEAKIMVRGNFTELTVKYHPELRRWLLTAPGDLLTGAALLSHADKLSGSWSLPQPIYSYPEAQQSNMDHTPNVFCYAAKEHPEFERKGAYVFSYACNSMKPPEIMKNSRLYHPVLVTLPMKKVATPAKR